MDSDMEHRRYAGEVISHLKNDESFRNILIEELADELCWSKISKRFLRESLEHLRPTPQKASSKNLQANIVLLNLGIGTKAHASNTEPYTIVRDVESLIIYRNSQRRMNDALTEDYSSIMELVKELYGSDDSSSRIDTIMYRDMHLWGKRSYWTRTAHNHP